MDLNNLQEYGLWYKINDKNELPSKLRGPHAIIKHNFGKLTRLTIYVDDIIVIGSDEGEVQRLKTYLSTEFEIKDLGSLKYFLRIEVTCSEGGIIISQEKYILNLLK